MNRNASIIRKLPFANFARRLLNAYRGRRIHRKEISINDRVFGSGYGGWSIDPSLLNRNSVVYSFGVGEDLTFDIALVREVGCQVHAFDPTPVAIKWIKNQPLPIELHFHPVGVAAQDGSFDFHVPAKAGRSSFSQTPDPSAAETRTVECKVSRLVTIMRQLGHSAIDVLKMDIEGFEFEVLDDMLVSKIRPRLLLVEFHHTYYGIEAEKTRQMIDRLRVEGYEVYWVSDVGLEYGLVLRDRTH